MVKILLIIMLFITGCQSAPQEEIPIQKLRELRAVAIERVFRRYTYVKPIGPYIDERK